MKTLLAFLLTLTLASLVVACGGDSTDTSNTPTASGATPTGGGPAQCNAHTADLKTTFLSRETTSAADLLTFKLENTVDGCVLPGPPFVTWYDSQGVPLIVQSSNGTVCPDTQLDFSKCVFDKQIELPSAKASVSPGATNLALAYVSVANVSAVPTCSGGTLQARYIGFKFSTDELALDAQVALPKPIELQTCTPQVTLTGFGPLSLGTPVPTVMPSSTPTPACNVDQLAGAFVSTSAAAGTEHYKFGISDKADSECVLTGPPVVHVLDAAGTDLGLQVAANPTCDGTNSGACALTGTIKMLTGQEAPSASPPRSGQVAVDVAIANIANFDPPCATSSQAHSIGLVFPGTSGQLTLDLPGDVEVQTCNPQVTLWSFE